MRPPEIHGQEVMVLLEGSICVPPEEFRNEHLDPLRTLIAFVLDPETEVEAVRHRRGRRYSVTTCDDGPMAIWWTEVDLRDKHGSAPEANDLVLQERNHDCQKRGHDAESEDLLGNGHQRSRGSGWLRRHACCCR